MRHGESEHNVKMVVNGDPKKIFHLTAKGRKQAVDLGKELKDKKIDEIIASEMKRTQETATPLAKFKKMPIEIDKRLNDIGAGGLEGVNILEFRRLTGDVHKSVKKSETNIHVARRIQSFLKDLLRAYNGKTVAIVTSEIILHALKQMSKGQNVDELKGHHVKNGVAYTFHIHYPIVCKNCGVTRWFVADGDAELTLNLKSMSLRGGQGFNWPTKQSNQYGGVMDKQYYVYILTNYANNVLYTGVTSNLVKRVYEHKNHLAKGFTSKYNVEKLVYFENTESIESAILREKQIKAGSRQKKIDLVNSRNPKWEDLYNQII